MCPMYLGVKMVIAKGIERIHKANLVNFGILPCLFADAADYDRIQAGDDLEVADFRAALTGDGSVVVRDKTQGFDFRVVTELSNREREIIADGGLLAHVARG